MFMPGKPQIWYLDLFAGANDYEAIKRAGAGGHKEINRTNLSLNDIQNQLNNPVVSKQLDLLRLRKTHPAFSKNASISVDSNNDHTLTITWKNDSHSASITADFASCTYEIHTN